MNQAIRAVSIILISMMIIKNLNAATVRPGRNDPPDCRARQASNCSTYFYEGTDHQSYPCSNGNRLTQVNKEGSTTIFSDTFYCICGPSDPFLNLSLWCSIEYTNDKPLSPDKHQPQPATKCSSIIHVDNLSVGEIVPLFGVDENLYYFSNRVAGRTNEYTLTVPVLSLPNQETSGAKIRIRIAGQETIKSFATATNPETQSWTYIWNGKDLQGKTVPGSVTAEIAYLDNFTNGSVVTTNWSRLELQQPLGSLQSISFGIGGWQPGSLHYFDAKRGRLHLGYGDSRAVNGQAMLYDNASDTLVASENPNVTVIPSSNGNEAYLFDITSGRHLQTRSAYTGKLLKKFTYDSQGRLTSIVDSFGNLTQFTRPTSTTVLITAPRGQVTTLSLNGFGYATSIKTPANRIFRASYKDGLGLLTSFTEPSGAIATFEYDSKGLLTRDQNSSGALWTLLTSLDTATQSRSIQMTTSLNRKSTYAVEQVGDNATNRTETSPSGSSRTVSVVENQSENIIEASGRSSTFTYQSDPRFGQDLPVPFQRIESNLSDSISTYFEKSLETQATNFLALNSESLSYTNDSGQYNTTYSGATNSHTMTSPMGRTFFWKLSDHDQPVQLRYATLANINMAYDAFGNLKSVTQGTRVQTFTYDTLGRVATSTDPLSKTNSFGYDDDGRLLTQTLPDGRIIKFEYDPNGNLAPVTPPSKPKHTLTSNLFDLVASYVAPVIGTTSYVTTYAYNNDKQLTRITRADASLIDLTYGSSTGRLSSIKTPEGTHTLSYNTADQVTKLASPGSVAVNWSYLGNNILTQSTTAPGFTGGVEYVYQFFRPISVKLKGSNTSTITLTYDSDNLLTKVGNLTIARNLSTGLPASTTLGVVKENFEYDASYGEISSYRVLVNNSEVYKETYVRNANSQITSKTEVNSGVTSNYVYTYGSAGRLATATKNGVKNTYSYDTNSNRSSVKRGSVTTSATYDVQDRMLTYGSNTYTHNKLGERTVKTVNGTVNKVQLTYDAFGGLKTAVVTTPGTTAGSSVVDTYNYLNDGLGRRIQVSKNGVVQRRFVYDEFSRLIGEINPTSGAIKSHFIYGIHSHVPDYMITGGVRYKLVHDQIGTVKMVINSTSGAVVSKLSYDEFGILQSGSVSPDFQPFGFAGGIRDAATGLVRFGVRDYDPESGRWTSKDPILFNGGDSNLYGYVLADPVNLVDPEGKWAIPLMFASYQAGFFIGATYNRYVHNIPYSQTYRDVNPFFDLTDTLVPFSGFFLSPELLESVRNIFSSKKNKSCP